MENALSLFVTKERTELWIINIHQSAEEMDESHKKNVTFYTKIKRKILFMIITFPLFLMVIDFFAILK